MEVTGMAKKKADNQIEKDEKTLKILGSFRKVLNWTSNMIWISLIFVCVAAVIVNAIIGTDWPEPVWKVFTVLMILPFAFALFTLPSKGISNWIEKKIATRYTPEILEQVMDRFEDYWPKGTVGNGFINNYEYGFPYYERVGDTTDYVRGVLHGIPLKFCEFCLEKQETTKDSDGEETTSWSRVFGGTIFILRHNLKLNGDILITQYVNYLDGVKMESQIFNEMYSVRADDEHDAFYLLTPQYMLSLMELSEKCGGKRIAIRFQQDGRLFLIVRGMNNFEIGDTTSTVELKEKFRDQMEHVAYILETLEVPTEAELAEVQ